MRYLMSGPDPSRVVISSPPASESAYMGQPRARPDESEVTVR
jgi:hypothetical protein